MSDDMFDPKTRRFIQTRSGVVSIPREQKGVPCSEYFRNPNLPPDLKHAVVYATPIGPVVVSPDPQGWSEEHGEKAKHYADRIKTLIDEKGYYSRSLGIFAGRLADETGHSREEMKAVIVEAFQREHGKEPFTYLQDRRLEQGLPVRDGQAAEAEQVPSREE